MKHWPKKNCYKASGYLGVYITLFLMAMGVISFFAHDLFHKSIIGSIQFIFLVCWCLALGSMDFLRTYHFRQKCDLIRSRGKKFQGKVIDYEVIRSKAHTGTAPNYLFLVSYFNLREKKKFWTPAVAFCPDNTTDIACTVYEYNGEPYAEDFTGWEEDDS